MRFGGSPAAVIRVGVLMSSGMNATYRSLGPASRPASVFSALGFCDAHCALGVVDAWLQLHGHARCEEGGQVNEFVVGVDGSDHSRVALQWAAATAGVAGVSVRAVQSWIHSRWTVMPFAPVPVTAEEMDEQTQEAITTVVTETL